MAWKIMKITRTAVAPWKRYHGSTLGLRNELLPRTTSAIMEKIQAAETSQTRIAPMTHNMIADLLFLSPVVSSATKISQRTPGVIRKTTNLAPHRKERAGRGLLHDSCHHGYVILTRHH